MKHERKENEKTHELLKHFLVTLAVLGLYLAGYLIPLIGVRTDAGRNGSSSSSVLMSMLGVRQQRQTIMALGIMPYINATILVQCAVLFRTKEARARISQQAMKRWTLGITILIAGVNAIALTGEVQYYSIFPEPVMRTLAILQLMAGMVVLFVLMEWNKRSGIGDTAPVMVVNIISGFQRTLGGENPFEYRGLLFLCIIGVAVTFYMENHFLRMPVQRVSINNAHVKNNDIVFKLSPIGAMPVMFASAVLLLITLVFRVWLFFFPSEAGQDILSQLVLTNSLGIIVYICIIMGLSVLFSFITLNPVDIAKGLQHGGDSLVNVPAGRRTKWYLVRRLLMLSLISGAIQSAIVGISLTLALKGQIPQTLSMFPVSLMMLVSFACSIFQEGRTYYRYDEYKFFL